ncbi:hypothetical protein [Halogeometricum limi]|uniref:Uncharacterized protein n=1 Tax=Halogeometricum limi TaxID=555875 RepID=A0A1I6G1E4_9EURY|nr:hypothetical protein [Halogeometricum limi]SFR36033.1 hypothetical protein SAMN04488124_0714 [Halogeometricum limi]
MVPFTRRRLLHGTVALVAGLAGCGGSNSRSSTATVAAPARRDDTGSVPAHQMVRNPENRVPVWLVNESDRTDDGTTRTPPPHGRSRAFVATAETAEWLRFADVEGAGAARQFVADTDFETETVFLESRTVRACHTLTLCHVSWTNSSVETDYGGGYRDADVPCEVDDEDSVTTLIRIPEALDPESVRSYGSGWSSSGCRRPRPRDDEATDVPDFGPKTENGTVRTTTEGR